tara:strand:- start:11040 stop:12287 length:1248 start_codon:yes stop_codon:yes gene_type:complete
LDKQDLIQSFSDIAKDKNVDRTEIGTIIENLFKTLIEKKFGTSDNCDVIVNIERGELEIYQNKTVVDFVEAEGTEISLHDAKRIEPSMEIGDPYIDVIDPASFGRRLIITAKQFLNSQIKDIEKKHSFENYFNRVGEIIIGDIRQINKDNINVYIEQSELRLPRSECIPNERYRRGDTIRAIVKSVEMKSNGPDIIISRADNKFLAKLFEMEVPEIEDGIIEIQKITRSPGIRAKIIVVSNDRRIDAVGACVGMRGSRIQSVVRELNGEKIDVINKSDQPEILISRALSPAKPLNLYIDDNSKHCLAVFEDEEIDSGVGRNYNNLNLASDLTGYKIEAVKKSDYEENAPKKEKEVFIEQISTLTESMIKMLSSGNIDTLDQYKKATKDDLLSIKGLGEKMLNSISERIDNYLNNS